MSNKYTDQIKAILFVAEKYGAKPEDIIDLIRLKLSDIPTKEYEHIDDIKISYQKSKGRDFKTTVKILVV
jgi:hypothetical protein